MVSELQGFEEEELPEDFTPGQPATEALMKELEIERLGGFFTTLQNVRNESLEQLIGKLTHAALSYRLTKSHSCSRS
jgi:hypothetical protein